MVDRIKLLTPFFRVAFPSVFEKKQQPNDKTQYSITMLFPKDTDFAAMKEAVKQCAIDKWGSIPEGLKVPFKDGNAQAEKYPSHTDMVVVEAKSDYKPRVRNPANSDDILIEDVSPEGFYAGCWARAQLQVFGWENTGTKGVSFGLAELIQKVKDDETFITRSDPDEVLDPIAPEISGQAASPAPSGGGDDGWLN